MSERNERSIGFIQGVVYAAGLIKEYQLSSEQLLKETGFSMEDLIKYGDPIDVKKLSLGNHKQKPTKPKTSELRIGK